MKDNKTIINWLACIYDDTYYINRGEGIYERE